MHLVLLNRDGMVCFYKGVFKKMHYNDRCGNFVLAFLFFTAAAVAEPALTKDQIEADWLRQQELRVLPLAVSPASDAAGGCDGVANGTWGFHTNHESQPWWQVDLGKETPIAQVRLFNRCDTFSSRASDCLVLVSLEGSVWQQVYQHNGSGFYGHTDGKPLEIPLPGTLARFVRIQLPRKDYLHLDEVEVYAAGGTENIALHKPAAQSSASQWSVAHGVFKDDFMGFDAQLKRGRDLAASLRRLGADVTTAEAQLDAIAEEAGKIASGRSTARQRYLTNKLQWTIRSLAMQNPLLDFDEILFVKRAPTLFPHVSDQYYGWFSRGGGGLYILSGFKGDDPQIRCITEDWPEGNFLRPDLSYDGSKVVFAWCRFYPHVAEIANKMLREEMPEDSFYHIFEINLDGTGLRQLTHGYYNDFDARYLPNDDIIFMSTRKGTALQAGWDSAAATCAATLPESYVRCGGDLKRPVPVFTLHRMAPDGSGLHAISAFENFEWTPAINTDGQIIYARWDYIDRFNGHFMSLWSTRPDGVNSQLVYGNFTVRPQCIFEARPIPNSQKLVFTATAHHSITGGSLVLLDRTQGTEYDAPIERITPEVCFPETEGSPNSYYAGPWPLSEEHFLVSWADKSLPIHAYMKLGDERNPPNASGIYLYDAFGNLQLLHRDKAISSETPIPIKPRLRPFILADAVDWDAPKQGVFLLQDVYEGMEGVARDAVARLRIVGVLPKVQPFMNQPMLGVSAEDTGKVVLGTVPVEADGSAHFVAPSGMPLFFQALDKDGMALRTMRTLTYVQPGQTLSCIGCHESREIAPVAHLPVLAGKRAPSKITLEAEGSWPLRFDALVQPVLDKACVHCHQPGYENARAAAFDLTPAKSYEMLINYANKDLHHLAFEKDRSEVGDCPSRKSKLLALLTAEGGHEGAVLDEESLMRLKLWMDTYAHKQGAFSMEQEEELLALKASATWLVDK